MKLFLEWKKLRDKISGLGQNPFLFVSQMRRGDRGARIHLAHDQLYRRFKGYLEIAGLSASFNPNALRHTYGVLLATQGFNAFDIQRRFGHAALTSTMVYVDLKDKEELERNKAMSEALRIKRGN